MMIPRRRFLHLAAGAAALQACEVQSLQQAAAQSVATGPREVPPRLLPVPDTVSPQMQAIIARPVNPRFNLTPTTTAEWKTIVDEAARTVVAALPRIREALGVAAEPTMIAGVKAFLVTPESIPRASASARRFQSGQSG